MKALVISPDAALREQLSVSVRTAERRTGESWTSIEAANGIQGIKLAWSEMPDLIIADEIASGAGGFAVAKELKGAPQPHPGAVVLILARKQDTWLAKWSGADAWVTKPVDPFELADRMAEVLQRQRLGREIA